MRFSPRSLTTWFLILPFALFCSISCGKKTKIDSNRTFYYNEPDGLSTLDPATTSYKAAIWAGSQIFNGLVELDSSLNFVPCLAKSWEVDTAGLVWTFHIRTDISFHEDKCFGEQKTRRMNARDVKFSFERICDARVKSTGLWIFRNRLVGAEEFNKATSQNQPTDGISGITVINDSTVQLRLEKPFAPLLSLLTMPYCWIIPHEAIDLYKTDFYKHPIGTGAFMFKDWQPDMALTLIRNPLYFKYDASGKQLPYLDGVSISFMRNTKAEFLEFEKGKLDFIGSVDASFADKVLTPDRKLTPGFSNFILLQASAQSVEYYGILLDSTLEATKNMPISKVKLLRQALNYAIDREKIIRFVLKGKGIPATHGVLPLSMPGFSPETKGYDYNPEKARELLKKAGYPDGKGLPKFMLQLGANERTASVAEAVQEQWKAIGVNLELRQVDFPQHLDMVRNSKLALWRTSWIGDYPDPENFLALFYSGNTSPKGPNTTHINRRDLDSLYGAALSPRLAPSQRYTLYNQMERIILDDAPWIFLYYNINQRLARPSVIGLRPEGIDRLILESVDKK
ncbi:MAG: ABC transporter substrate-binding protein [Ignavibacteriae bacterium]|nr:ABC transporter substrate-binding protein [Ignavibacteriota bacterium]